METKELTLEILQNMDLYVALNYAHDNRPIPPIKPKQPMLSAKHTSQDVLLYADQLEKYEEVNKLYKQDKSKWEEENQKVTDLIEQLIKDHSGFNTHVPEQYQDKIWNMAWDYGHASGYYEVYNQLNRLIEIFE